MDGQHSGGRDPQLLSQELLYLVERFTRTADDTIAYRMTFTDPETWVSPWTGEMLLKRQDQPIYEFACHEGHHSMVDMLTIARYEEAVAADRRKTGGR